MSQLEKLNNVKHADLRIITERGAAYGDDVMFLPVYPNEMRALQACYPLLFFKDSAQGSFHPVALFGFEEGENLFLRDGRWDAPYLPLMAQRGPMMIGFDHSSSGEDQPIMAVDVQHPRVSKEAGEALFLEHGGNSPYLDRLTHVMELIHIGHGENSGFVRTLDAMELIAPCSLKIKLKDGSQNELAGFYMVDDERLAGMTVEQLEPLIRQQFLLPTYMMLASMSQLQALIRRREQKLNG